MRTCFGSWLYLVLRRYVMSRRSTTFGQMFHSLYLSAYCVLHRYAVQYVKAFPPEHPCSTDGHISVRTIDQIASRMEPLYSLFSPTNDHISRSTCVSSHSSPSYWLTSSWLQPLQKKSLRLEPSRISANKSLLSRTAGQRFRYQK